MTEKNYFDFIFLPHMIHAQCIDRKGIVQDGKKTEAELSSLAKTAVGELSGSGIDMIHDQPWGSRCLQFKGNMTSWVPNSGTEKQNTKFRRVCYVKFFSSFHDKSLFMMIKTSKSESDLD